MDHPAESEIAARGTFGDRTAASLEALGIAIATLNHRIDKIDQRIDSLERAVISLGRTLGASPVMSNEIDPAGRRGVKH
jgi:hypothetical protein